MAVVNTVSSIISNADAAPPVHNKPHIDGGMLRVSVATLEIAAGDDDGSTYRFFRVPSGARVHSLRVLNDAITGGTAYNCGLYNIAAQNGGALVNGSLFASSVDMSTARTVPIDLVFEQLDIANAEKRIWELLSLTRDPHITYDVVLRALTVGTVSGTITLQLEYVI